MPESKRAPEIPEPSGPPLTYQGEKLSPGLVMRLWRSASDARRLSRDRILNQRAYRRREEESLVRLAPSWVRRNPEAAAWVVDVRPERTSLEQDLIARVGVVEPEFIRERLGFTDRDRSAAEECQAFMEEWRLRSVPTQALFGKAVEDGEFGWSLIPSHLDIDGVPTFFETLDEQAYTGLSDDQKTSYREDEDSPRRKRYVKVDASGKKRVRREYDKGDPKKDKEAHKDAIARYLLHCAPANVHLIPALDCAPIFRRGKGRDRWECIALVQRTLYEVEELLEMGYGWPGLGDRALVPLAYDANGSSVHLSADDIGKNGLLYLYTAYLICKDKDGHQRPVLCWTVGGTSTTYAPTGPVEPEDDDCVGSIDFYEALAYTDEGGKTCSIEGPLWGYGGGMHSEDDDPDQYWRPAMWHILPLLKQLEGNQTAINATITQVAFTGHVHRIDAALANSEIGEAAILEEDGSLRTPNIPKPGEVESSTGPVEPFQQTRVGADAWQKIAADQLTLQAVTAVDQMPSSSQSGNAQMIALMTGQQSKRQIRDGVKNVVVAMGEVILKILDAYYHKYGVGWPIQTTQERPVGDEIVEARDILQYDPLWVGKENKNYRLDAEYPEEENLARIDLEVKMAQAGYGNFDRVMRATGEKDPMNEYKKVLRDRIRNSPMYLMSALSKYAEQTGNPDMIAAVTELQQQGQLQKASLPGAKNGMATVAMSRPPAGEAAGGLVGAQRAGIQGGQIGADQAVADAESAYTRVGAV